MNEEQKERLEIASRILVAMLSHKGQFEFISDEESSFVYRAEWAVEQAKALIKASKEQE